jgi:hypothetical protein
VENRAVGEALKSTTQAATAPVVVILLEAAAAHNEGKVLLRRALEAIC